MFNHPLVVHYGGGVDSTAMLIGLYRSGVVPDLVLFADTGSEKPETYDYVGMFSDWLQRHAAILILEAARGIGGRHETGG